MVVKKNYISKTTEYTVSYSGMRGVDFSTLDGKAKRYRFSHLENMYKDYSGDGDGVIESIPGFRKLMGFGNKIYGIYSHTASDELYYAVHAGSNLYHFPASAIESIVTTKPVAVLRNTRCNAFKIGEDLYFLDGVKMTRIDKNCNLSYVGDGHYAQPYIPLTYYNGEEYEQRNLLTEQFREKYIISSAGDMATESEGLIYTIISNEDGTVGVCGIEDSAGGVIYIPAYTYIAGKRYKIIEISSYAFYTNTRVTGIILSDTVKKIGKYAFGFCTSLTRVICRSPIEIIDNAAFYGCTKLNTLHLGSALKEIGEDVFNNCAALLDIDYEGSENEFAKIDSATSFDIFTINYDSKFTSLVIEIPIFSPANAIEKVTVNGEIVSFSTKRNDSVYTAVVISASERNELDDIEVEILGSTDSELVNMNSVGTNFYAETEMKISGEEAIMECTVCECFDGRVFLSGNPKLPNTVFYSSRDDTGRNNPLYFGVLNYFNDGTGPYPVKSMLAAGDSLAVFKAGDDGGGSIYYHTPKETGVNILPKVYPVSYVHSGVNAVGESISFFDDHLFLSPLGLTALDKKTINLERSITTRSGNVNPKLLGEDLENISMAKWCGYLVLQAADRFYLADSRDMFTNEQGKREYEWYYLSGIGTYTNASKVFRYSEHAKDGYNVHPTKKNKEVDDKVYLTMDENYQAVYYTTENGIKYEVYTDGELRGGTFSPASCVYSGDDNLLLFGTESGDLCIFNNDKRGVPPPYLLEQSDFNEEEYQAHYGREIHPFFYNFDYHAPRYALKTVSDDGGIPNFTKSTVKHSLVLKLRCIGNGSVNCEVGTEKSGYKEIAKLPDSALNFAEFDFENLSFANIEYATLALKEREKGWIEKNIALYSEKYSSPFGIYSIIYRFTIKGKIKH